MKELTKKQNVLLRRFSSSWKLRMYFLFNVPSLFFWKVKIEKVNTESCTVTLPYSWKSKNPFSSIYFAAQAGAAELSTGALALLATYGNNVSSLVSSIEGEYMKKGTSTIKFVCNDGDKIFDAVERSILKGEAHKVKATSIGFDADDNKISSFIIEWSFKYRQS